MQQQCSCHVLIYLMSLSHQKAARAGKCEAELWLPGLSRPGLSCRCEGKHNKLGKAVQLYGFGCCVGVPVVITSFISNCIAFALCSSLWCLLHLPTRRCPHLKTWNCQSGWCFHIPVANVNYLISSGRAFSSISQVQGSSWSWALLLLTPRVPRSHLLFSSLCMTCYHETSYQQ